MGLALYDETQPLVGVVPLDDGDTTALIDILTPNNAVCRLDSILVSSTAAASHTVTLSLASFAGTGALGSAPVPAGAGFTTIPIVDLIPLLAPVALGAIIVPATYSVKANVSVALGAGEALTFLVIGGTV